MKPASRWLRAAFGTALTVAAGSVLAQPVGQWDFDAGSLSATVGGTALTYKDGNGGITDQNDAFGTTTTFGLPDIAGSPADVIRTPGSAASGGYRLPVAAVANGGGTLVNQWTVVMDLLIPDLATVRGLLETDLRLVSPDSDLQIDTSGGIGANGAFAGSLTSNTWYRIAFVVDASANIIRKYVDGQLVGTQNATRNTPALDGNWALDPATGAELFNDDDGQVGIVYVNSLQLYSMVLSPGQVLALGAATANGLPTVIPPVPPYLQTRSPEAGATGVVPNVTIQAVLDQGSRVITPGSVKLQLDGVDVAANITGTAPTYTISYQVPTLLAPESVHTAAVLYTDNVAGAQSISWTFTVTRYQQINLPAPIHLETFDSITQGTLPTGWSVTNNSAAGVAGINYLDPESEAYRDWVVISRTTGENWTAGDFSRRTALPTIVLNEAVLPTLLSQNFAYAESDQRGGSQVQVMFTRDYDLTGYNNVFVSFWSSYEQNQDNIGALEYSIDGGANWLPVVYLIDDENKNADVIYSDPGKTQIDAVATLNTARSDQAYGQSYGTYIGAPVSQALAPYISGRINDDFIESKRIESFRLPQADNQPAVRFRFMQAGTASWYWGIDNFGLYSINTPVITLQPQARKVSAGEDVTFTVEATINPPFTYQWRKDGNQINGATGNTYTINGVDAVNAGEYSVVVTNGDGSTTSQGAILTVVTVPEITSQPRNVLVSAGQAGVFEVANIGRQPFTYAWYKGTGPTPVGTLARLTIDPAAVADEGDYSVVVSNVDGSVTSSVARLSVFAGAINQDLVAHLKFDGTFDDASGRGNNGSGVNGPTFIPGAVGTGALHVETSLGSHTNFATLGNAADLDFGTTTDFSVSFWIKLHSSSGDAALLGNKDWDSGSTAGWVFATDSDARIQWNVGGTDTGANGNRKDFDGPAGTFAPPPVWKHVVATFDRDGVATTYVNGEFQNNRSGVPTPFTTISNSVNNVSTPSGKRTNIGQDGLGAYYNNLNADFDEVGIWRRVLTPEEVRGLFRAGSGGLDLQQAVPTGPPLPAVVATRNGTNLELNWQASPNARMQTSPSLTTPDWTDVPGTTGAGSAVVPINPTRDEYFRLFKP